MQQEPPGTPSRRAALQLYLDPPALEGCGSEDILVVVLGQLLQELPHLLLPFEGAHLGSDHCLLLICRIQTEW